MASAADNRRGILAMLTGMFLFIINDALMKIARETYPPGQAIGLRAIFAVTLCLAMVLAFGHRKKLRMAIRPDVLLRSGADAVSTLCFISALGMLPLGNVTAIGMASPLIIVLLAAFLGIERVGWRRMLAVTVGFCGVLVIVRPSAAGLDLAATLALANAGFVAARDLLTRRIGSDVPSLVISLSATIAVGALALAFGLSETWQPMWRIETAYLAVAAMLIATASFLIVSAFRNTDLGVVSGFRYSVVIFAVIIGYLVWGDIPDALAFVGIALIVGSGLYTIYRQEVLPHSDLNKAGGPPPA